MGGGGGGKGLFHCCEVFRVYNKLFVVSVTKSLSPLCDRIRSTGVGRSTRRSPCVSAHFSVPRRLCFIRFTELRCTAARSFSACESSTGQLPQAVGNPRRAEVASIIIIHEAQLAPVTDTEAFT